MQKLPCFSTAKSCSKVNQSGVSPGNPGTHKRPLRVTRPGAHSAWGGGGGLLPGRRALLPILRLPTDTVSFQRVCKAASHGRGLLSLLKRSPYLSAPTFLQTRPARNRGRGRRPGAPHPAPSPRAVTHTRGVDARARGSGRQVPGSGPTAQRVPQCPLGFYSRDETFTQNLFLKEGGGGGGVCHRRDGTTRRFPSRSLSGDGVGSRAVGYALPLGHNLHVGGGLFGHPTRTPSQERFQEGGPGPLTSGVGRGGWGAPGSMAGRSRGGGSDPASRPRHGGSVGHVAAATQTRAREGRDSDGSRRRSNLPPAPRPRK